jgi:hypothetical protein
VITNQSGAKIKLKVPIQSNVDSNAIYVEAVESITTGNLWEPALRSAGESGHVPAVLLNKHHDFYQKIYKRAAANGYTVDGMDLLLWAFAVAEQNYTNPELAPIFEDIRSEVSLNLKKLLRNMPELSEEELRGDDEE